MDGEYEVGLAELQFRNCYPNILEKEVYFYYERHEMAQNDAKTFYQKKILGEKKVYVPEGLYESNQYLIAVLNNLVTTDLAEEFGERTIKFAYNEASRRASISTYQNNSRLWLSDGLRDILGITQTMLNEGQAESYRTMNVDQNVRSIFVYTDLVQPRPVGDVVVPLLRCLPPVDKKKDTMHYIFEKPHYIPLARLQFDTVEFLLTNDKGDPIPFEDGHSIVTLHFRRRRLLM